MPKTVLDWLAIASAWVASAVMAVKAGDLPLIAGAPLFFAARWWGDVPFVLFTFYLVVAIYRLLQRPEADEPSAPAIVLPRQPEPTVPLQAVNSTGAADENGRIFLGANIDAKSLMAFCANKTSVHAKSTGAPYIGKWLKHQGPVFDVYTYAGEMTVSFGDPDSIAMVKGHFKSDALADVLHRGDVVEVIGRVSGMDEFSVDLEDCEITHR